MSIVLAVAADPAAWQTFLNHCLIGLTQGSLYALIALGYTMVYGIIGLINFAHGDLFMLGACLALTLAEAFGLEAGGGLVRGLGIAGLLLIVPLFCAALNVAVDWLVYRPLRNAPKLAPLVSAIGVSYVLMNVGLLWIGAADRSFPPLVSGSNLLAGGGISISWADLLVIGVTLPAMILLTLFVRYTKLGTAMRATEQNAQAARLMGVPVERVTSLTFALGGALAGVGSVVYALYIKTVGFQMGFQNGLYAFTAAVLGGIGSIPGAVLGGVLIGLIRSLGSKYIGESWNTALIFGLLILILVFRPVGLLGRSAKEKV